MYINKVSLQEFMREDLAEFSLKYLEKLGVKYAEVRLEERRMNGFILKNGNLEAAGFDTIDGIGMRFIVDDVLGFISVNKFDKDKIKTLIKRSFNLTKKASQFGSYTKFSEEKHYKKTYKLKQKIKIDNVDPDKKIKNVLEIDKTINHLPARIFQFGDSIAKKYYINSDGSEIRSEIPDVNLFYLLTIGKDETIQRYLPYGGTGGYELYKKWKLNKVILDEVKALEENLKKGIKQPQGKFDIVLGSEITGIAVHESVGHPYEADRIFGREAAQAGESFVTEKMLGTMIGSEIVNVADDPTIEGGYGSFLYDDEGIKARRKYLIKNGKISEFLHNRETAFRLRINSNGSSRANNFDKEPLIRMSNTFMLPGKWKEDEIIKDTKNGIYMKSYMEWNIDDKRFHQKYTASEAYLIKNGKIKSPIKKPSIEITTPAFWKSIDAIGNIVRCSAANCGKGEPMQGIPVWMGGPMVRLRGVTLK